MSAGETAGEKDPEAPVTAKTVKTALSSFQVNHASTGADLGTWSGRHQGEALGRLAVSLGYESYVAMCAAGQGGERLRVTPMGAAVERRPRRCSRCGTTEGSYTTLGGATCDDCV